MIPKWLDEYLNELSKKVKVRNVFYSPDGIFENVWIVVIEASWDEWRKLAKEKPKMCKYPGNVLLVAREEPILGRVLKESLDFLEGKGIYVSKVSVKREVSDVIVRSGDPLVVWWDIEFVVRDVDLDSVSSIERSLREHLCSTLGDGVLEKYKVFLSVERG